MVIAIPLSAVLAGIVMITIAGKTEDGLVVDDYYKVGNISPSPDHRLLAYTHDVNGSEIFASENCSWPERWPRLKSNACTTSYSPPEANRRLPSGEKQRP